LQKAAQALVAYITTGLADDTIVSNIKDANEGEAPYVGCGAERGDGEDIGTGNLMVEMMVSIKYRGAVDVDGTDPKSDSDTLTARVYELLRADNLADQLTASISNFTVLGFATDPQEEIGQDGDFWVETWRRRAYCAGADLSG
jgi:hypothetical protein